MPNRREFLEISGALAAGTLVGTANASPNPPGPAPSWAPGGHKVADLPFAPGKLTGLSAAMLTSHHDNNYAGAVKNLNKVELELARTNKDTPAHTVSSLRERELTFTNSKILHELYFGNLGGDGKVAGTIERRLLSQWGTSARWEEQFRATAMSLGGGSGWVVLDLNFSSGDLRIYGTSGHNQSVAFGAPLLVLDMFEHAYAMDFGASHARYVDAYFQNVAWGEVDKRLLRAEKALSVLRP
jgi:Fe-Mn family superoxide dismutase